MLRLLAAASFHDHFVRVVSSIYWSLFTFQANNNIVYTTSVSAF